MRRPAVDWPTCVLIAMTYAAWGLATTWLFTLSPVAGIALTAIVVALFSSLQHEALHGHPTRRRWVNAALVFPALALVIPFFRFRDLHLAHHRDSRLTDPYDDPESNYFAAADWARLPRWAQAALRANNTLIGRMTLGPLIGTAAFLRTEARMIRAGDRRAIRGWLWHLPALVPVLLWIDAAPMGWGAYALAVYAAMGLLRVRTFLEHRADAEAGRRTVIIEDRGPFAFLFLNNNLHVVHHLHPLVPWYRLPQVYRADPERYLGRNGGYRYASYFEVFRRYFLTAKDPVVHPLWHGGAGG